MAIQISNVGLIEVHASGLEVVVPGRLYGGVDFWGSNHRVLVIDLGETSGGEIFRKWWAFESGWLVNEDCEAVI